MHQITALTDSKDMHEPLVPMLFPILGAHISGAEFQYPDLSWKVLCGQMANLVRAKSPALLENKAELLCYKEGFSAKVKEMPPERATLFRILPANVKIGN